MIDCYILEEINRRMSDVFISRPAARSYLRLVSYHHIHLRRTAAEAA